MAVFIIDEAVTANNCVGTEHYIKNEGKGVRGMENVFFKQFLMISDIKTIVFLAVLVGLFYLIHVL